MRVKSEEWRVKIGDRSFDVRRSRTILTGRRRRHINFYLLSPNSYLFYAMGLKPTASKQAMASSVDRKSRKALAASGLALFFMTAAG